MADFDADDKNSWYLGLISRDESNNLLNSERDSGVFFVRDSTTIKGDFVLCVKEDSKISHYIINKIQSGGVTRFRIGDQEFTSLPALLNFYKTHYLDTTSLIRPPINRPKFVTKYRFEGRDPDDLPFEKGEILTLVRKDEEQWWTVRNERGNMGLVPVPYIERYNGEIPGVPISSSSNQQSRTVASPPATGMPIFTPPTLISQNGQTPRKLPAWARVIRTRIPSAYDTSQLRLQVGEDILVTAMHINGQWEGQLRNGTSGFFPFTHIKFLDEVDDQQE
jgi:proto-oncogene C-crk